MGMDSYMDMQSVKKEKVTVEVITFKYANEYPLSGRMLKRTVKIMDMTCYCPR
jgi:hypothetical protein